MGEDVDEEKIKASWENYKAAATKRGLKPIRVHYNTDKKVGYCETEAPSATEVMEAHQEVAMPPQEIIEVKTLE